MNHVAQLLPDDTLIRKDFKSGEAISAEEAMLLCFEVAKDGLGFVSPNPLVGCVIVDSGHRFLSYGAHLKYGDGHAEVNALSKLNPSQLQGATVYVSLEPCAHQGQTPPCSSTLAKHALKAVYYAVEDPNPKVSGGGAEILKDAGIACKKLPGFENLAWEQNALFFTRQQKSKDVAVGLKAAMSLDGCIAQPGDQKVWISCERSLKLGHYLRLVYDGICVGANTLILDNPYLTPRKTEHGDRIPWRIVLDPDLRAVRTLGIERINLIEKEPQKVIFAVSKESESLKEALFLKEKGVHVLGLTQGCGLNLSELLNRLPEYGLYSLMLEGGAGLYQSFLENELVDRFQIFMSHKHLYGTNGIPLFSGENPLRFEGVRSRTYASGDDCFFDVSI